MGRIERGGSKLSKKGDSMKQSAFSRDAREKACSWILLFEISDRFQACTAQQAVRSG